MRGVPENASGIMTLVYADEGFRGILAREINEELKKTGFQDLGVVERPGLVVLRRTQMPAVLVEAGFIDNPEDNRMFDEKFEEIAEAIAAGIEKAAARDEREKPPVYYMVQTGAYRMRPWQSSSSFSFSRRAIPPISSTRMGITR